MGKEVFQWIKSIALAVVIAIIIKAFLFNTTYVLGTSMYPTLHERDRLITNKIIYMITEPKPGDIVVLKAPDNPEKDYIKRIIAVEGDTVLIKDGNVLVNGVKLDESYLPSETSTYPNMKTEVPKNNVFILGDNRSVSKDSRRFGSIPIKLLKGKASFRYFPFNRISVIQE